MEKEKVPLVYVSYDLTNIDCSDRLQRIFEKMHEQKGIEWYFSASAEETQNEYESSIPDGNIQALNQSSCVIMFITRSYAVRVNSTDPEDFCRFEFINTLRKKKLLLPVIVDHQMANQYDWEDRFGAGLLDFLCYDFSKVEFYQNQLVFNSKCQVIIKCVQRLYGSSTIVKSTSGVKNNNELLSLELSSTVESLQLCSLHPQYRYQLFDVDCQKPLCVLCYATAHSHHTCQSIPDKLQQIDQEKKFPLYAKKSADFIQQAMQSLKLIYQTKERLQKNKSILESELKQCVDSLQIQLAAKLLNLQETLTNEYSGKMTLLNEQEQVFIELKKDMGKKLADAELTFHPHSRPVVTLHNDELEEEEEGNEEKSNGSFNDKMNGLLSTDDFSFQGTQYLIAFLNLEKEIMKMQAKEPPFTVPSTPVVTETLTTKLQDKEIENLTFSIRQLGNYEDTSVKLLSLLQRYQIILKNLQTFLCFGELQYLVPFQQNLQAIIVFNQRKDQKSYETNKELSLSPIKTKKTYKILNEEKVYDYDIDSDEEERNSESQPIEFSFVSFNQIFYLNYCQEILEWLQEEFSDETYRYILKLLMNSMKTISIAPLSEIEISSSIKNTEVMFLPTQHTGTPDLAVTVVGRELAIRYKRFSPTLKLKDYYPSLSPSRDPLTERRFASSLPKLLFSGSKILYENVMILSLLKMVKDDNDLQNPFHLIYQGSKHGMTLPILQSFLANQSKIIILMKSLEGYIFGGFTSVGWKGQRRPGDDKHHSCYSYDAKAFLFSLKNPYHLDAVKLSVANPQYAIQEKGGTGFCFGGSPIYNPCTICTSFPFPSIPTLTSSVPYCHTTVGPVPTSSPLRQLNHTNNYSFNNIPLRSASAPAERLTPTNMYGNATDNPFAGDMYLDSNFLVNFHPLYAFHDPTTKNHLLFTGKFSGVSVVELEVWQIA
jgi:hypothetical protein